MFKKKPKNENKQMRTSLNLKEFMLLKNDKQEEEIRNAINEMYGEEVKTDRKSIEKILNICFDEKDAEVYLANSLKVAKKDNNLIFSFKKSNATVYLYLLFIASFIFIGGAATYAGVLYNNMKNLNIDLDEDGIADLNIDLDGDNKCDINCDENDDDKPDYNIDYRGNRKVIFNYYNKNNELTNLINIDTNGDGKCNINCDTNEDGWPDLNIDYNGDGKIDLDKDTNEDGIKDLNIDTTADGVCDLNCDEDDDDICDKYCMNVIILENGGGVSTGNGGIEFQSAVLIINFESEKAIVAKDIYPDDQPNVDESQKTIPDLIFTVQNTSSNTLYYDINWLIEENSFESNNFQYKIESDYNGYKKEWTTAPFTNETVATKVAIEPNTTQHYVVSMKLHGIGAEQNFDQGKTFKGVIKVDINNEDIINNTN